MEKSHKSKPDPTTLTEDTYMYDAVPAENLNYSTVAATTEESAAFYDSVSAPTYSKLDHTTHVHSAVVKNTIQKKQTLVKADSSPGEKHKIEQNTKQKKSRQPVCLLVCFTVLIIAVIAAAVAVAMAFVLIAGLRSDLTAALKDSSSSSGSTTESVKYVNNISELQPNKLLADFNNFRNTTYQLIIYLNQNTSDDVEVLKKKISSTQESITKLNDRVELLTSNVITLEKNVNEQLNKSRDNTTTKLQSLNNEVLEEIMNASNISLTTINTLTDRLVSGIQDLHTFDSCAAVPAFPIQFPSGMYNIRSGNSAMKQQYCMFSCNGISGGWTRIAYLNTDENPISCPSEFEVRSADTTNPPLCRRDSNIAGCSSVIYPSNGTSYSQVCGSVRIHQQETPDGFQSHKINIPRNNQSVNQNYVDGVSLTHGTSPNRAHIWTYTAVIKFGDDIDRCTICGRNKPFYIGTNFTCTAGHCSAWPCGLNKAIWTNGLSCFGNETFYRQLSESTTDNIEMRVCRDQRRHDEDILISYVELFVA